MSAGTMTTSDWLETMEKTLFKNFTASLEEQSDWKKAFREVKSSKRREELLEYALPGPVVLTPEGAPYNRLQTDKVRLASVVHDDYTGEERISHQLKRDKMYDEMEAKSWGLGESVQRKLNEDAASLIYNGFASTLSPDLAPWFGTHSLAKAPGQTYSNLISGAFGADAINSIEINLLQTRNERNGLCPMGDGKNLRIFVPPALRRRAKQFAMTGQYEAGGADFNVNVFDYEPICLPFLANAAAGIRDTQYYACDPTKMMTYFFLREGPIFKMYIDEDTDDIVMKVRISYSFLVASWRGWVGSTGA